MSHHFNLGDQVAGALVRGVVYQAERSLFHGMSTMNIVIIGAVIIGAVWMAMRPRRRRY